MEPEELAREHGPCNLAPLNIPIQIGEGNTVHIDGVLFVRLSVHPSSQVTLPSVFPHLGSLVYFYFF